MFWDDWDDRDFKIYGIFVAIAVLLLWNIILTIYIILLRRNCRNGRKNSGEITTTRIATSPIWNQIYVPKIPRVQKMGTSPTTISSIPQSPSEWFGNGPDKMNDNIFF